jgi:hypothetical protein
MSKYMVGDELLLVDNKDEDVKRLNEMTKLKITDHFAELSWGLKILNVEYDKPNVTLTYRNVYGEVNKVFAICSDIENFDTEKVLEKALLKAFQSEIINISVKKNSGKK